VQQEKYRGAWPDRLSKRDGFGEHALANIPSQHSLGRDVNVFVQLSLKVHEKASQVHETPIVIEVDQQVQITQIIRLASCN
jgi:hypothetical protein